VVTNANKRIDEVPTPQGLGACRLEQEAAGNGDRKVYPGPSEPIIVSDEEVVDRYMKCALRVLCQSRAEQVGETVLSLEKVQDISDISELMTLLTFPDKR